MNLKNLKHGEGSVNVGRSSEYVIWGSMLHRCRCPTATGYPGYGGRGITVCVRWESFVNFLEDMGRRPSKDHSIERVDNESGYCKDNCVWATRFEQQANRRLQINNKYGIAGLCYQQKGWLAAGRLKGKKEVLYWGYDFFEACCARKSWEAKRRAIISTT